MKGTSNSTRVRRILQADGRALVVALDHTLMLGIVPGWERPYLTLEKIMEGHPDAILTTFGIVKYFRSMISPDIGIILRIDGGSPLYEEWGKYSEWKLLYTIEDAVRLGVDGVICMGLFNTPCELQTVEIICRVAAEAMAAGLVFAVEALPLPGRAIEDSRTAEAVATVARLSAEYGADMIKTYYTGSPESFRQVTSCCPAPVLVAGGPKSGSEREVLEAIAGAIEGGAAGAFVGRNVWQRDDPARMIRVLAQIIHNQNGLADSLEMVVNAK
jgi:DhnA family fructose-bisphosphate aldolase class Ia